MSTGRVCSNWGLLVLAILWLSPSACRSRTPDPTESRAGGNGQALASTRERQPSSDLDCPGFGDGKKLCQVENEDLDEASDIAVSAKTPGIFWSHNDSGGRARLFAFDREGRDLGTYHLEGAELEDWEDMAIGPGPVASRPYLYVGDIGANTRAREQISVYRVEEPDVKLDQKPKKRKLGQVEQFRFVFPDAKSHDCEALMVDPRSGDVYLVTKARRGAPVVYRRKAPLDESHVMTLEEVTVLSSLVTGPATPTLVTSGDIAPDGSMILLRTYDQAYLWRRQESETIDAALSRPPCRVSLKNETQGESIGFAPDGKGYYTVSEGRHPKVYYYAMASSS